MAVFDSDDKIRKYQYKVSDISLCLPNKKPITIRPENVTALTIEEDYENNCFPLFKLSFVTDNDTYYEIYKNKNACKIHLRIDKYFISKESSDPSLYKNYINSNFEVISDDDNDNMYNSVEQDENKTEYDTLKKTTKNELDKVDNKVELYLFQSVIAGTKKNVNKVIEKCNVTDAICYLMSEAGINNVIMSQPDNIEKYDEFLIPPLSILKALSFIDYYYGIYKKGSMMWFGIDYTYIIPYDGGYSAGTKREVTTVNIIIPKATNVTHETGFGSLHKVNDKNGIYIVADYSSMNKENESISNNYLNANSIQSIDSYNNESDTVKSTAVSKNGNFTKVYENKTENKFISSMYTAQSNAKSTVISLRLQDEDISNITPNKKYKVICEDTKYTKEYNGEYLIAGVTHTFAKTGNDLTVNSVIILRKTK